MEVESLRGRSLWRPGVKVPPYVGSGLEHHSLGLSRTLALQIMFEERELNIRPEVFTRFRIKLRIAQMIPISARPAAMHPRPFNQRSRRLRVELVYGVKSAVWPGEVFRVIPASHNQHRALHILHML